MKMEKLPMADALEAAREALSESKGNVDRAAKSLADRAKQEPVILHALALAAVERVAPDEGEQRRQKRAEVWTAPNYDAGGNGHRVHALAAGNAKMLMDFPLALSRVALRDANRDQVRADAEWFYEQGSDMVWKSRWLALVASKMPEGKKVVGKVLTEAVLVDLQEKAKHAKR